ncbi:hypothetical protein MMC12_006916 [Toensbergia leucococca]|nr:hypothetical protein [Toensbergia leucococca]
MSGQTAEQDRTSEAASEANDSEPEPEPENAAGNRKAMQKSAAQSRPMPAEVDPSDGRRIVPVRQSRIKDRPAKVGEKDSSLKIKIELDLEVEVDLYARVKGDIVIGLM